MIATIGYQGRTLQELKSFLEDISPVVCIDIRDPKKQGPNTQFSIPVLNLNLNLDRPLIRYQNIWWQYMIVRKAEEILFDQKSVMLLDEIHDHNRSQRHEIAEQLNILTGAEIKHIIHYRNK